MWSENIKVIKKTMVITGKTKISIIFTLLFIVLLCLNFYTVETVQDDYRYKFSWVDQLSAQSPSVIHTLSDVFSSQYYHYQYQNGRSVPHFFLQVFDGLSGKGLFNIINSIMFCMLIWMMNRMSNKKMRLSLLMLSIGIIFFFTPIFKETILWMAGSVNYLWSFVATLAFVYICKFLWNRPIQDRVVFYSPLMLFLGWVNEGATIPVSLSIGFLMLIRLRHALKSAVLPFAFFFFIGVALTVFAPATFNRMEELEQGDGISLVDRCLSVFAALREVRIFWVYVALCLFVFIKNREIFNQYEREQRLLILCVFTSFIVFFISNRHYARVLFFIEMFSTTGIITLLYQFKQKGYQKWISGVCAVALCLFLIPLLYYSYLNKESSEYALAQLKDPKKSIVLTKSDQTPRFFYNYVMKHVDYGEKDVWYWACEKTDMVAEYFGKTSLEYYPEELYQDMLDHPEHYKSFHTLEGCKLYAMQIPNNQEVKQVVFHLTPTNHNDVPIYSRLLVNKLDKYSSLVDYPRSFRTKMIGEISFLIFTPPVLPEKRKRWSSVEIIYK